MDQSVKQPTSIQWTYLFHSSLIVPSYFLFFYYPLALVMVKLQTKLFSLLGMRAWWLTTCLILPIFASNTLSWSTNQSITGCIQLVWSSGPQVSRPSCYAWLQVSAKIFIREVLEGQAVDGTAGVGGRGGETMIVGECEPDAWFSLAYYQLHLFL